MGLIAYHQPVRSGNPAGRIKESLHPEVVGQRVVASVPARSPAFQLLKGPPGNTPGDEVVHKAEHLIVEGDLGPIVPLRMRFRRGQRDAVGTVGGFEVSALRARSATTVFVLRLISRITPQCALNRR